MDIFKSSKPIVVISLITANLFPFYWIFLGETPRPENFLFLYWLETWIIGFYNIFKIQKAVGVITPGEERLMHRQLFASFFSGTSRGSISTLFAVQYSIVVLIYGLALFGFFVPIFLLKEGLYIDRLSAVFPSSSQVSSFILAFLVLIVSHGISYTLNYTGRQEFLKISPFGQMLKPYDRIVGMHLILILGAMILGTLKNLGVPMLSPQYSVAALVLVKLLADLSAHLNEHMIIVSTESVKPKNAG